MAMRRPTRAPVCLQVDMSLLGEVVRHVDVSDPRFCVAVLAVLFNPFFWNVVRSRDGTNLCYNTYKSKMHTFLLLMLCLYMDVFFGIFLLNLALFILLLLGS